MSGRQSAHHERRRPSPRRSPGRCCRGDRDRGVSRRSDAPQRAAGALEGGHALQGHRCRRQLTADKRPGIVVIIDEKHVSERSGIDSRSLLRVILPLYASRLRSVNRTAGGSMGRTRRTPGDAGEKIAARRRFLKVIPAAVAAGIAAPALAQQEPPRIAGNPRLCREDLRRRFQRAGRASRAQRRQQQPAELRAAPCTRHPARHRTRGDVPAVSAGEEAEAGCDPGRQDQSRAACPPRATISRRPGIPPGHRARATRAAPRRLLTELTRMYLERLKNMACV